MNDMSEFRRANFSAAPAAPTGAAKLLPWARAAVSGGLKIGLLMYVAQIALPHDYKPSVVFGQIAGDTEASDIEAKRQAAIAYERAKADAAAQAQTKAQADLLVMQKTLDTTTASVDPLAQLAGAADVLCVSGRGVAAMSAPTGQVRGDWRGITADDGFTDVINKLAKAVAGVSCGASAPLRETARVIQLNAVRDVAAARGLSMTNGATQPVVAPSPVVNLALAPHHHLNADQQRELRIYANGIPVDVLRVFVDGLDMAHGTPDAWYDRVAYYRDAARG